MKNEKNSTFNFKLKEFWPFDFRPSIFPLLPTIYCSLYNIQQLPVMDSEQHTILCATCVYYVGKANLVRIVGKAYIILYYCLPVSIVLRGRLLTGKRCPSRARSPERDRYDM